MKRLLLLTFAFPPASSPGALRPGYLAQYLSEFGWDVTVVTRSGLEPPFPARVVSVARYDDALQQKLRPSLDSQPADAWYRRFLRSMKSLLLFPDEHVTWILPALKTSLELLRSERYDAILSTAMPASVHVVAGVLSRITGVPWIADYRDPWSQNTYWKWGPVRRALHKRLEVALLRKAAALTTVSEPIAQGLRELHRRNDVYVIPNAYDAGDWSAIPMMEPQGFDLCYTGHMYDGQRDPDLLFGALAQLRAEGHPAGGARVHFYGNGCGFIPERAARFGLSEQVHCHGSVPRVQALTAQRASAAVLIFLSMDPATRHELGSKYLEYLGAQRPMLVFGPKQSALQDVIEGRRLGWFASDLAQAVTALRQSYDAYDRKAKFEPDRSAFLTARDLTQRFAAQLDRVSGAAPAISQPQVADSAV